MYYVALGVIAAGILLRKMPRFIMHCTENLKQIFPEMKLHSLVPNFYIHVSVHILYILTISLQTQHSKIGGPIVRIYKSLTDT
jgi:hypothetical protein